MSYSTACIPVLENIHTFPIYLFFFFFGKILINKISKPKRKNYIYDRNFIVQSRSFHLRLPTTLPLLKKIYICQNYTKNCAMHKSP